MTTPTDSRSARIQRATETIRQLYDDLVAGRLYPEDLDDALRTDLATWLTPRTRPASPSSATPPTSPAIPSGPTGPVYVVTAPEAIRGIHTTWGACEAAVTGVRGAKFQKVSSRAEAEAILSGEGVRLSPGVYAFVDGNDAGGIGVVCVRRLPDGQTTTREVSTTVQTVLTPRADSQTVTDALATLRNVLAELAACYQALTMIHPGTTVTIVHDYVGIEKWIMDRWQMPANRLLVELREACVQLVRDKSLTIHFLHQPGHRSSWAGTHEYAQFNTLADTLATRAGAPARA